MHQILDFIQKDFVSLNSFLSVWLPRREALNYEILREIPHERWKKIHFT